MTTNCALILLGVFAPGVLIVLAMVHWEYRKQAARLEVLERVTQKFTEYKTAIDGVVRDLEREHRL